MYEQSRRHERLSSERAFEAARGNLFAAVQVLFEGGLENEVAYAAETVREYHYLTIDRMADYTEERLDQADQRNMDKWVEYLQNDELLRSQHWERLAGISIFQMTSDQEWRQQAVSFIFRGQDIDPDLADKLGIDPISYLSEEDSNGEWVNDRYGERLAEAIDNLMTLAPPESHDAFLIALERFASGTQFPYETE